MSKQFKDIYRSLNAKESGTSKMIRVLSYLRIFIGLQLNIELKKNIIAYVDLNTHLQGS